MQPHSCCETPMFTTWFLRENLRYRLPDIKQQNWRPAQSEDDHDGNEHFNNLNRKQKVVIGSSPHVLSFKCVEVSIVTNLDSFLCFLIQFMIYEIVQLLENK